jgi:hypothetical protein
MVAAAETISQVIATFEQAAALNRTNPLRRGNVVELDVAAGDDVLISADLHGNRRNFRRILDLAALDEHPRRHLVMQEVCHGGPTYPVGNGCMSHLMLEDVAELKTRYGQRFHFLLSNHELAELTDFPIMKAKRMLNLVFRCGMQEMYGEAADRVRDAATDFIASLPLAMRLPNGVFVCHSLPADTDTRGFDASVFERELQHSDIVEGGPAFRLTWGRDYRQENADAFAQLVDARVVVTGHEPCPNGFQAPNDKQIILDCCGEKATYALLPISTTPLDHASAVAQVRSLHNGNSAAAP